jgi:hypothetical protein
MTAMVSERIIAHKESRKKAYLVCVFYLKVLKLLGHILTTQVQKS